VNSVTNKVYIANILDNTVTVIDGATNGTTTVTVGSGPEAVAVNQVTNKIYVANVANAASNTVTVIDGATHGTSTVTVGRSPEGVVVNPVTNKVYVANGSDGTVTVIDGATNGTTTVTAGSNPRTLTVNPVTNKVYAASSSTGTVTVIDVDGSQSVPLAYDSEIVYGDPLTVSDVSPYITRNTAPVFSVSVGSVFVYGSLGTTYPAPTALYYWVDDGSGSSSSATAWSAATVSTSGNHATFTLSLSGQSTGLHTLYYFAAYGDEGTPSSSCNGGGNSPEISNLEQIVYEVLPATSSTAIVADVNPQSPGGSVTFTATVTPGTERGSLAPTGTVYFYDGTTLRGSTDVALSGGSYTAAYTTTTLTTGSQTITALYGGDSNYAASSGGVTEKIAVTPTITWVTPAAILYGTALSATQLNASASYGGSTLPGTFAYTPAAGTVLIAGTQSLSVTFTPTDTTNYTTATGAVQLQVNGPATLLTPAPGTTLTTSAVAFSWSSGTGVTAYSLAIGDLYKGSSNLYSSGTLHNTTSVNVTGLPVSGENLYVRLCSLISLVWQCSDYSYSMSGTPTLAALTSPTPGTALTSSSTSFQWSAGSGITGYILMLGTTGPGAHDLYNGTSTQATSASVSGLPVSGATIYARLFSQFNGSWSNYVDYTYTGSGAALLTPTPGSTLSSSSVTFTWSPGTGVTQYTLAVSDLFKGNNNLYQSAGLRKTTSVTVGGLPVSGENLYVRLCSYSSSWQCTDYNYGMTGTPVLATLSTPAPSSVLPGASATFQWTAGSGVTNYILQLGTMGKGSKDIYNGASTTSTSVSLTTLPSNGVTIYARLYSQFNGNWTQYNDYTYTEFGTPVAAALVTPAPSSTLSTSSVAFTWSAGTGVTSYQLCVGNLYAGNCNLYASGATTAHAANVTGLAVNGEKIYVRLYSLINGVWQSSDYNYMMSGTPVLAALTSPAPGSTLAGASVTFNWSAGTGVTGYMLQLGTTGAGSHNLYSGAATAATSASVSGLPVSGGTVYARLYSQFNGGWTLYNDYTYTAF
jgi:YVTN family beta-propeller protein